MWKGTDIKRLNYEKNNACTFNPGRSDRYIANIYFFCMVGECCIQGLCFGNF